MSTLIGGSGSKFLPGNPRTLIGAVSAAGRTLITRPQPPPPVVKKAIGVGRGEATEKGVPPNVGLPKPGGLFGGIVSTIMPVRSSQPVAPTPVMEPVLKPPPSASDLSQKERQIGSGRGYIGRFDEIARTVGPVDTPAKQAALADLKRVAVLERGRSTTLPYRPGYGGAPIDLTRGIMRPRAGAVTINPPLPRLVPAGRRNVPRDEMTDDPARTRGQRILPGAGESVPLSLNPILVSQVPGAAALADSLGHTPDPLSEPTKPHTDYVFMAGAVFVAWLLLKGRA